MLCFDAIDFTCAKPDKLKYIAFRAIQSSISICESLYAKQFHDYDGTIKQTANILMY